MSSATPRTGHGRLPDDWGAKAIYLPRSDPLWRRTWVRRLTFCLACGAGLAGALGLAACNRWRDDQLTELARQRRGLEVFLRSDEFATFARAADAQLAALNNFIAALPRETRALLPEVAASETARGEVGWTFDTLPLAVSAANDPERIYRAQSALLARLAQRDWRWDEAARRAALALYVRMLTPAAGAFIRRSPGDGFAALAVDRAMQEAALAAFAARHGPAASTTRAERMFWLLAMIGPEMWRAVERPHTVAFTAGSRGRNAPPVVAAVTDKSSPPPL